MKIELENMKSDLKALVVQLVQDKRNFKNAQRKGSYGETERLRKSVSENQFIVRHKHIAYCMARGTKYEAIENKVNVVKMEYSTWTNIPHWNKVEQYLADYGLPSLEEIRSW